MVFFVPMNFLYDELTASDREQVRRRDNNICAMCGIRYKRSSRLYPVQRVLSVHHIDGDGTNNEGLNLISVCTGCHMLIHSSEAKYTKWLELIAQSSEDNAKQKTIKRSYLLLTGRKNIGSI